MDIQRAKEEIKRAVQAYLATDDIGRPLIPAVRQRPILLMGPPGVGKTQIMEQIAAETGVGLVAYTIHPPHPAVRHRSALHRKAHLRRGDVLRHGVHHERDPGLRL